MGNDLPTPDSIAELTPEWLTRALHAGGVIGAETVTAATYEPLGAGAGFVGQLARIQLTYDRRPEGAPETLIAKMPGLDPGARELAALYGLYELEFRFYSEIADEMTFRTARCYYAAGDAASVRYVLLIEDMGATGTLGDQVKGCTLEQARMAIRHLAAHHAHWWRNPRLAEIAWLSPGVDLVAGALTQSYPVCWERALETLGDEMPPQIREAIPTLGTHVLELMEPLRESALTLGHGDYRLDNMFFGNEDSGYEIAVLDWQSPNKGWGAYDVAYFLYSNLDVETRREHEDTMLRDYHAGLVAGGVRDYSYEQLHDDYVASMLVSLAIWVINAATLDTANERGFALFQLFFERLSAAILDLNALDRIPAA